METDLHKALTYSSF